MKENDEYLIEMAVAGVKRQDLTVDLVDHVLYIAGTSPENNREYLLHGIAERRFTKFFMLADTIIVTGVKLEDGILTINLKNIIPEEQTPITFSIE